MNDVDDRLRELLERKATDVPPHGTVPRTLRRRARRRVALNAVAAVAVVVALGGGAVGTLSVLDRADTTEPAGTSRPTQPVSATGAPASIQPTPTPATSTASSVPVVPACTAGQLRIDAQLDGAMGSLGGELLASNYSSTTCTLRGVPAIALLDDRHHPVDGVDEQRTSPSWKVDREPKPEGWPIVTLGPGDVSSVRLRWSNWCGASAPLWQLALGGETTQVYGMDSYGTPPCNGADQPSILEIGPFEPQP
jgi:hypothetical protein